MNWTRSITLPLASSHCVSCHGLGLRNGRLDETEPCNCVLRAIFRACYLRFRDCSEKEKTLTRVTLDGTGPQCRRYSWGRKDEEYIADFILISKRALTDGEYKLFRFHYLLGADWRLCARRLGVDKGMFYHFVYRIQRKLGRAFRETAPYGLFPLDQYFYGVQPDQEDIWAQTDSADDYIDDGEDFPVKPPAKVVPILAPLTPTAKPHVSNEHDHGIKAA